MKPIIEFCVSNVASGSYEAMARLEKDPNVDVMEYDCLRYCGICSSHCYALVNGEVVTGDSAEELVENIYTYLEEHPMF
jgi:uncharacterized protein YuzB (UPF0349 family)